MRPGEHSTRSNHSLDENLGECAAERIAPEVRIFTPTGSCRRFGKWVHSKQLPALGATSVSTGSVAIALPKLWVAAIRQAAFGVEIAPILR